MSHICVTFTHKQQGIFYRYDHYTTYQKVFYPLFLYAPTIGVILMCVLIAGSVRSNMHPDHSTQNTQKWQTKAKQAVLQLFLIVVSFLIGYVPFTGENMWSACRFELSKSLIFIKVEEHFNIFECVNETP